jgi:preprotein translocase subunit YajC
VSFLIVMVLLLVVMYVLMIRPQRQRQREQQSMIDGASVGDDVLTSGGIYGTITRVEGDDVVVEIAEGLNVHMTRRGIAAVLPPESDEEPEVLEAEVVDEDELDEAPVTGSEEAVTSHSDSETTAGERR